jgi:hypothetical protein
MARIAEPRQAEQYRFSDLNLAVGASGTFRTVSSWGARRGPRPACRDPSRAGAARRRPRQAERGRSSPRRGRPSSPNRRLPAPRPLLPQDGMRVCGRTRSDSLLTGCVPVKLHSLITALDNQGTEAETGRLGVLRLMYPRKLHPSTQRTVGALGCAGRRWRDYRGDCTVWAKTITTQTPYLDSPSDNRSPECRSLSTRRGILGDEPTFARITLIMDPCNLQEKTNR